MRVKKIGTVFFATIIMGLICIAALFGGVQVAHAESPVRVRTADITYPIRSADRRGSARI